MQHNNKRVLKSTYVQLPHQNLVAEKSQIRLNNNQVHMDKKHRK